MRLGDLLHEETVDLFIAASSKEEVIRCLVEKASGHAGLDVVQTVTAVLERERALSTGVGQGVAVPHATIPGLATPVVGFGRTTAGVSFDSIDGQPVHLLFLLLSPEGDVSTHLKLLSRVSRLCQHSSLRDELAVVQDARGAIELIRHSESPFLDL